MDKDTDGDEKRIVVIAMERDSSRYVREEKKFRKLAWIIIGYERPQT